MLIIHQHNLCVPTAQKGYYDNTLKIGPFIMVYLFTVKIVWHVKTKLNTKCVPLGTIQYTSKI